MDTELKSLTRAELEAEVLRLRARHMDHPGNGAPAVGRARDDALPGLSTPAGADVLFSAVEKTSLPMIVTDPNRADDPIVFANRAFFELTGYAADEVLGRNCRFLQGPDTEPERLAALCAALDADRDIALEITNHRRDGTPFVNHLFVGPVFGADGQLLYRFGSQLDVTEAHRNRTRLVESEERQRAILDSAIEMAIIATDPEGRVTDWNAGAERILGWSAEEMRGRTLERIFTPEDRASGRMDVEMRRALAEGSAEDERWHFKKDGGRFYAAGDMTPLRGVDGAHRGFVKAMSDRTAQREAAAKQQADAEFMRRVLASSADCIKVLDLDGHLTFMSEGGLEVMEVSDFNLMRGCPWPDFWEGQGHADAIAALAVAKAGSVGHFQGAADTYLGTPKWWDVQVTPILGPDGRPEKILSISRDITNQKAVEGELAASEERWRGLFTGMQEGFLSAELVRGADGRAVDFRFLEVNPAFAELTGLPADSAGRTMRDLVPDIPQWLIDTYARVVETGAPESFEIHVPELRRTFEVRARKQDERRFAALFLEISERKRAEARRAATAELGDRLRDVSDRGEIVRIAAEVMGRTLGLSHAGYGEVDPAAETIQVEQEWTAPGLTDLAGLHRFRDYGSYIKDLKAGRDVVIEDTATDPRTAGDADTLAGIGARAMLNLPVLERGRFVALFYGLRAEPGSWTREDIAFVRNVVDRTRSTVARVEAEARRDLLNRELSHRMKNLLAMVQSIAAQTMRSAPDVGSARDVLGGRLIALGKAHDLLMGGALVGTRIGDVVREALAVHGDVGDRLRLSGTDEGIGADQALSLSLMLHELATNAAKYGALSNGDGQVEVSWERLADGTEPLLRLRWREVGGPPVAPPTRKGFGTRFIQRALATQVGGDLSLDYLPEGVECTLTAPLAAFGATREVAAPPWG